MSNITIESIMALYDRLPKPEPLLSEFIFTPRVMDALELQRNFNQQLNAQAETILRGIPVFVNSFPQVHMPRRVLRSQYKTRAGFKHARRYWRAVGKKMRRAEEDMAYMISATAQRPLAVSVGLLGALQGQRL